MRRGGGDVAGAGAQFVCFTGTKVLAYWYKSTNTDIARSLALAQGVRLLQRANALLPLDHSILGALRDLLH